MLPDLRRALRSFAWPLLGLAILIAVIVVMSGGGLDSVRPFISVAVAPCNAVTQGLRAVA